MRVLSGGMGVRLGCCSVVSSPPFLKGHLELAMALDLSGKRLSCPIHPETETQALFIGCACFPSYEINKVVEK